jgi:hypothetical protein
MLQFFSLPMNKGREIFIKETPAVALQKYTYITTRKYILYG